MKILVTGARGYLASALIPTLATEHDLVLTSHHGDLTVAGLSIHPLALEEEFSTHDFIMKRKPDLIVNTAAISQPDWAEDHREETYAANVTAVANLVHCARDLEVPLLHLSTDYVFSGTSPPYAEDAPREPVNYYGQTKLQAEEIIERSEIEWLICRTTMLYGRKQPHHRKNVFVDWSSALRAGNKVQVPTEHQTNPTYVIDLASTLKILIEREARGVYHTAGRDSVSRYEFAKQLAEVFGFDSELVEAVPIVPKRAVRPKNTTLRVEKLKQDFGLELRGLHDALLDLKKSQQSN